MSCIFRILNKRGICYSERPRRRTPVLQVLECGPLLIMYCLTSVAVSDRLKPSSKTQAFMVLLRLIIHLDSIKRVDYKYKRCKDQMETVRSHNATNK